MDKYPEVSSMGDVPENIAVEITKNYDFSRMAELPEGTKITEESTTRRSPEGLEKEIDPIRAINKKPTPPFRLLNNP